MAYRNREDFNAAWRRWYVSNAKKKMSWQRRRQLEFRAWFAELKATYACAKCGMRDPDCIHFHHRDPATKSFTVSDVASLANASRARILAELRKCDPLCANCHAKLHWRVLP